MATPAARLRTITDWAKHRPRALHVADWLGRGRGRLRFLDRLGRPAPHFRRPNLHNWDSQELAAIWIGHATVLLRIAGLTLLTDPVFANRIGFGLGLITGGPMRLSSPALSLRQLPPIDLILISHAHFDHLDRPTLHRLSRRAQVVTAHGTSDLIRDLGFPNVTELRWGETLTTGPLNITAREVRHSGARTLYDGHRSYNAFLLEAGRRRVFFGGDTAWCDHFRDIPGVDLAIFGIGAYNPYIHVHASPEQAWDMANQMRAERILPMHHSTFRLSHEPVQEPIQRMLEAAGAHPDRIAVTEIGGQWTL